MLIFPPKKYDRYSNKLLGIYCEGRFQNKVKDFEALNDMGIIWWAQHRKKVLCQNQTMSGLQKQASDFQCCK